MMHTNELGLLLSELMNQMQSNLPGSGQCNKPGGKNKKPGNGLPKSAETNEADRGYEKVPRR